MSWSVRKRSASQVDSVLYHDREVFTRKYSSALLRRKAMRAYAAAAMATTKVRMPMTLADVDRGESVFVVESILSHWMCVT